MEWTDYFYADPTSPTGLRWSVDRYWKSRLLKAKGDVAGHKAADGYWKLSLTENGKKYQIAVHRVLWKLTYGYEPVEVDHINGDRADNSLRNLREVTRSENMRNRAKSARKKIAAPCGVFRTTKTSRHGKTYTYWVAGWYSEIGKYEYARFSVLKLGDEEAYKAACDERKEKMKALTDYTERHGEVA